MSNQCSNIATSLETSLEYRHSQEFPNPFYVIVHAKDAAKDKIQRKHGSFRRTLEAIESIRRNYDHAEINGSPKLIPQSLPDNRPILVCGFFRDACVAEQAKALLKKGYKTYISLEGTFPN